MTYELRFDEKATYLHVVVTGENSRENVARYIEEALRECAARRSRWVLIEERLDGPRLGTIDVFEVASKGADLSATTLEAVAYVDANAEGDLMGFAETVAVNRGFPVKVFQAVADAEDWLLREARRSTTLTASPKPARPQG